MYYLYSFLVLLSISIVFYYGLNRKRILFFRALFPSCIVTIIAQVIICTAICLIRKISVLKIITKLAFSKLRFIAKFTAAALFCEIILILLIHILHFEKESATDGVQRKKGWLSSVIVYLYTALIMTFIYLELYFPDINLEQLLFTLRMPLVGTSSELVFGVVVLILVIPIIFFLINYFFIKNNVIVTIILGKISRKVFPIHIKQCKIALSLFALIFVSSSFYRFNLIDFVKLTLKEDSLFYEEHYIDPRTVTFDFPEQKKNLILIYLESMEAEAASTANPGINLIPELSQLAENNISFSHNDALGGQLQLNGTGWSMAALCCTHLGIPLTLPIGGNSYENTNHFFNGAYGLGDLLKDNGYILSFLMGADAEFGGLRALLKTHGDFNIKDSNYYRENGYVPKDYHVWWGIEDKKIIEYSKKELIKLGNAANPFMFSVFLEDTHSPSGYMDEDCEQKYSNQIHNVFSCTSKRVAGFVKWIKEQPFYHNTVIVLLGDHLYMGNDLYTQKKSHYERHAYNAFINTGRTATFSKNRAFATFDFFPTIIESLGVKMGGGLELDALCFQISRRFLNNMVKKN